MLGQADDLGLAAERRPLPGEALQQPGAEGVEFADAAHVDRHAFGPLGVRADAIHEGFELGRMRRRP